MKKILLLILSTLLLISCTKTTDKKIATESCDKKIIVSSHFADFPLPANTCPLEQATNANAVEQKFTISLPYKDAITEIKKSLSKENYTITEQPEMTIGGQKTWSAQIQKNTQSQRIYIVTITNQNPKTLEIITDTTFLIIREQNFGG